VCEWKSTIMPSPQIDAFQVDRPAGRNLDGRERGAN